MARPGRFLQDNPEIEVASSIDLERCTCELFYALARVATSEDVETVYPLREQQRAYIRQYQVTAGHVISLTNNLANVRTFVTRNRKMRHAALFQAVSGRHFVPSLRRPVRPYEERLFTFAKRLGVLHGGSDITLPTSLRHVAPENKWHEPLDGYEIYEAAQFLGEHAAEDMVNEDQRFLRVIFSTSSADLVLRSASALLDNGAA